MIDLRSDTVTTPSEGMRRAMAAAAVGDDVYGEDPSVRRLEETLAGMAGHAAGLFFPSGTQSNLVALLSHCARGDEYIATQNAHTYRYEAGGAAVLGSLQPQPLAANDDGTMDLQQVAAAIKVDDIHFAKTRLLTLENTSDGRVLPPRYVARACTLAREHGLGLHLDGARAFNAAIAQGVELAAVTGDFDSVSICLSKGLGAPVGSVLCGAFDFITRARRWRKMAGGGMRQAGGLAAAGLYALDHHVARLQEDHDHAAQLAAALADIDGVEVVGGGAHTNMVFAKLPPHDGAELNRYAKARGLLLGARLTPTLRMVTHLHISSEDIATAAAILADFFRGAR